MGKPNHKNGHENKKYSNCNWKQPKNRKFFFNEAALL